MSAVRPQKSQISGSSSASAGGMLQRWWVSGCNPPDFKTNELNMNARRASIVLTALCLGFLGIIAYMAYLLRISSVTTHADVSPPGNTKTFTHNTVCHGLYH